MSSENWSGDSSSEEYVNTRPRKRHRINRRKAAKGPTQKKNPKSVKVPSVTFQPLIDLLPQEEEFEKYFENLSAEWLQVHKDSLLQEAEYDEQGRLLRPLSRFERNLILTNLEIKSRRLQGLSLPEQIITRKLELARRREQKNTVSNVSFASQPAKISALSPLSSTPLDLHILSALQDIRTTPFDNSFLSRLFARLPARDKNFIFRDWETRSPWIELMDDIRCHYSIAHPDREQVIEAIAPIDYLPLGQCHLQQVNDLLVRTFWPGIDVSDCLQASPAQCSVVAVYKNLVVGAAFLSSPLETYLTYIVVRAGWEKAKIATFMLHHLITSNPNSDVILHVSATNHALLLYNRFGFKAEEFVLGFYENYLDNRSKACRNALRLRLRR